MAKSSSISYNEAFIASLTAQVDAKVKETLSAEGEWDLEVFYNRLLELPADTHITSEDGQNVCHFLDSYRGYNNYPSLSSGRDDRPVTAEELAAAVKVVAEGKLDLEAYKGGTYTMSWDSALFFSEWGEASGLGICGISDEGVIQTFESPELELY